MPDKLYQIQVKFLDGSSYLNTPASKHHCEQTQQVILEKEKARFMRFANGMVINLNNATVIEIVEAEQDNSILEELQPVEFGDLP